ncbi:hypothetical protein D3C75_135600 [compost metagenome]
MLNAQKRSLYEFDWQLLRVNLDFSTISSTEKSLQVCNDYLMAHQDAAGYYKVINLFAASVMGLEGQIARRYKKVEKKDEVIVDLETRINIIQVARLPLSDAYESMPKHFRVDQTQRIEDLGNARASDLVKVYNSLRKRWTGAQKRNYNVQRDELAEYIMMLIAEMDFRGMEYLPMPAKWGTGPMVYV